MKSFGRGFLFVLIILLFTHTLSAQAPTATAIPDYPTVSALEQAEVPAADGVDLARRFRDVGAIPTPAASVKPRQVGEEQAFWVMDTDANREFQISATLRVVGEHIYLWVETAVNINTQELQTLATAFDKRVYPNVRALWGNENNPGIDGDPRLYGLLAHGLGGSVAAYFSSRNTFPKQVWRTSNEHEMFLFNLDALGTENLANIVIEGIIAHEFQHMIRDNIQHNEDSWLNEGFSTFTQLLLYGDTSFIPSFLNKPATQLNDWPPDVDTSVHYGAADLFVAYYYERYGQEALQRLSNEPGRGLDAFDRALKAMGEPGVNEFFADWVLANAFLNLQVTDDQYGYKLFSAAYGPTAIAVVNTYPYAYTGTLNQYATDYHVLSKLDGKHTLDIHVDAPTTALLIPSNAPSGNWMWYSNRGDQSDMTLTQPFDLTGVKTATLQYKVWYDTEEFYDYGYVTASSDGGKNWQILTTPSSDSSDPVNSAYGAGYTGDSGGWHDEQVSLDAYAGQDILLRFEFIADDSTLSKGMAIDTVSIAEIGYESDFEQDSGGWQAAGWVRTDNRLPQQVWVQAVQKFGQRVQVSRWLAPAESDWQLALVQGVDQVIIAISPFAPVTNTPTTYTLDVAAS